MTRILVSPVGNQDPYSDRTNQEGSIVTICRAERPDVVYLLPTADRPDVRTHTSQNAQDTVDWLASEMPATRCYVRPLDVGNPTDYEQVVPKLDEVVRGILLETQCLPEPAYLLNASSSTTQIKVACLMLVAAGVLPARVLQVANPETMTGGTRITEIDVGFLQEQQVVERARSLYRRHLFGVCAGELRNLAGTTYRMERRSVAQAFAEVCDGYAHLDRLEYHRARQALERGARAVRGTLRFRAVDPLLKRQAEALADLTRQRDVEGLNLLGDVYHNGLRRLADESYVDAVTRAWRIVEGCLRERLRRQYGIEPANLDQSPNQANLTLLRNELNSRGRYLEYNACLQALETVFADPDWGRFARRSVSGPEARQTDLKACLEELRLARNRSVAGHGSEPVSRELAEQSLRVAKMMLQFAFERAADDWPFAQDRLTEVAEVFFSAM